MQFPMLVLEEMVLNTIEGCCKQVVFEGALPMPRHPSSFGWNRLIEHVRNMDGKTGQGKVMLGLLVLTNHFGLICDQTTPPQKSASKYMCRWCKILLRAACEYFMVKMKANLLKALFTIWFSITVYKLPKPVSESIKRYKNEFTS